MAIQEKFVQAGEYRTHYWEVGEGENVLMLHSADPGAGGWLEFRENMEALGRQFRLLAPDIIGFGKTDSPTRDLRHPAYVEHMVQFLDALGVKKTHLIGNCRGGLISISIAAEHPDRVGRLILIGNAGGGIPPELEQKALAPYANYTATRENLKAHLEQGVLQRGSLGTAANLRSISRSKRATIRRLCQVGLLPDGCAKPKTALGQDDGAGAVCHGQRE